MARDSISGRTEERERLNVTMRNELLVMYAIPRHRLTGYIAHLRLLTIVSIWRMVIRDTDEGSAVQI